MQKNDPSTYMHAVSSSCNNDCLWNGHEPCALQTVVNAWYYKILDSSHISMDDDPAYALTDFDWTVVTAKVKLWEAA